MLRFEIHTKATGEPWWSVRDEEHSSEHIGSVESSAIVGKFYFSPDDDEPLYLSDLRTIAEFIVQLEADMITDDKPDICEHVDDAYDTWSEEQAEKDNPEE